MYKVTFLKRAEKQLSKLDDGAFKKALLLIEELTEHPRTGTGKPKQLRGQEMEIWSRQITQKHRLVYLIKDEQIEVLILSARGHYGDK